MSRWERAVSLLFLSKVGLSLWVGVYTLLGALTLLATETAAGQHKLEEDSQVSTPPHGPWSENSLLHVCSLSL